VFGCFGVVRDSVGPGGTLLKVWIASEIVESDPSGNVFVDAGMVVTNIPEGCPIVITDPESVVRVPEMVVVTGGMVLRLKD